MRVLSLSGGFTPCRHLRPSSGREHTIARKGTNKSKSKVQVQVRIGGGGRRVRGKIFISKYETSILYIYIYSSTDSSKYTLISLIQTNSDILKKGMHIIIYPVHNIVCKEHFSVQGVCTTTMPIWHGSKYKNTSTCLQQFLRKIITNLTFW